MSEIGMRILVVDNHDGFRRSLRRYLTAAGFDVIEAASSEEALEVLDQSHVDLVLTDLNMPGICGVELISLIRSKEGYGSLPIFVLSVTSNENMIEKAFENGASAFLQKPFSLEEFYAELERCGLEIRPDGD